MERRAFVGSSVVALGVSMSASAAEQSESRELFELRTYSLKPCKRGVLDAYLSKAFIPAAKRLGCGPVGVFAEAAKEDVQKVFVLVIHKNAESVAALPSKLAADAEYTKAASDFLAAKAADPVYHRIESSLLLAIGGVPRLIPYDAAKPRLFNLRVYESHNEQAAAKKIEMFEKGEIEIFKKVGLTPVFFASSVIGAAQPNLTYMLVFPDEAERQASWNRFRAHPDWLRLKAIPEYADKEIVSKITNYILTPAAYSEI
jgi:hypothetical protein